LPLKSGKGSRATCGSVQLSWRKNMALKDIICQLCDPGKFTGVLKCPHGKFFTRYTEKALEAAAERAIKELGGN
jgi:hypothetical protein